eukprot:Blabericola_migrator_1__5128@NODE_264_length_10634_cov_183_258446_g220_i0_p3_GENE_NODE_264_length_10634_cov_183_258446_g220_i0NODE_264_length_10634_cov_183_258446_g220_i0_p3_ORF_typecomplete_len479_score63_02CENPB_dimeris/PF09026_10/1_9e05GCIP/PF13324_6/0_00098TFIIF_alpha/PF05793_12/0_0031PBP1_TM/PF14812_6/0_013SDA1/PF05285_12/0_0096BUD22/PF09073_10/0_015YL1/PF05764_13/0_032Sigma70_ner/PF04546_13/0_082Utp14/PF04615_13/0_067LRS4/PF10422_9/0_11ANAPC15/PF15243_6/0_48DNA_pol_phi/PF04931_13/0_38RNA_p
MVTLRMNSDLGMSKVVSRPAPDHTNDSQNLTAIVKRAAFQRSVSRTSTCCTGWNQTRSTSASSDADDETWEPALSEVDTTYTLRRNSTPELDCEAEKIGRCSASSPVLAIPPQQATYILYLLPSKSGKRGHALDVARDYLGHLLGFDESHLYPLHCTLTSFFTITAPLNVTKDQISAALSRSLICHLQEKFNAVLDPFSAEESFTKTGKETRMYEPKGCRHKPLRKWISLKTLKGHLRRHEDDDEDDDDDDDLDEDEDEDDDDSEAQSTATTVSYSRPNAPMLRRVQTTRTFSAFQEEKVPELTCSSCIFDVRHVPFGSQSSKETELHNVHVTDDGSIILPMTLEWKGSHSQKDTKSHLKDMCKRLQNDLIPGCLITMPRRSGNDISAKSASHMALTCNKSNATPEGIDDDTQKASVRAAARIFDSAAAFEPESDFWDLALCEMGGWGTIEGSCVVPHTFREVLRIGRVGMTKQRFAD